MLMTWMTDQRVVIFILPALSLLVAVLAVALAWVVELRARRKLAMLESHLQRLLRHKDSVTKQFTEVHAGTNAMGNHLNRLTQQLQRLEQEQQAQLAQLEVQKYASGNSARSGTAVLAEQEGNIDKVLSECDISKAEAELLLNLHRARRPGG